MNYNSWKSPRSIIDNDILEYYSYLPASIIFHDLTFKFSINYQGHHEFKFWGKNTANGAMVLKMTMGMAYLYLPFFYAAHWYAYLNGYDTGGFSAPYQYALLISALFYFILGLFFLRKILERYFKPIVVAVVLLLIVFGTNLFYFSSFYGPMTHVYSFALFNVMIYYTIKWYEKQTISRTLIIGIVYGLLIIMRPPNAIFFLFFIFFGINSLKDVRPRIELLFRKYLLMFLMVFCVLILWIPQIIYWKMITGQWFYYSYGDEHFFFLKPQLINGLFSFRKGLLIYTPMVAVAFIGMLLSYKTLRSFFLPSLLVFIISLWIIFSWWCWWYGGSFGQRSAIDMFGLMAIGLAVVINYLFKQKVWIKMPALALILLLMFLNIFNSVQYHYGALSTDAMTKAAYFENFGHREPYGKYWDLLQCPDYNKAKLGIQDTIKCK